MPEPRTHQGDRTARPLGIGHRLGQLQVAMGTDLAQVGAVAVLVVGLDPEPAVQPPGLGLEDPAHQRRLRQIQIVGKDRIGGFLVVVAEDARGALARLNR